MTVMENGSLRAPDYPVYHTKCTMLLEDFFETPNSSPVKQVQGTPTRLPPSSSPQKSPSVVAQSPAQCISPEKRITATQDVEIADIEILQSHTQTLLKLNDELKVDLTASQKQCDTFRRLANQRLEALDATAKQLDEAQARAASIEEEMVDLRARCIDLSRESNTLHQRLVIADKEKSMLEGTVQNLRNEVNGLMAALEEREVTMERLRAELKASAASTTGRSLELDRLLHDHAALTAQNRLLMQDVATSRAETDHLRRLLALAHSSSSHPPTMLSPSLDPANGHSSPSLDTFTVDLVPSDRPNSDRGLYLPVSYYAPPPRPSGRIVHLHEEVDGGNNANATSDNNTNSSVPIETSDALAINRSVAATQPPPLLPKDPASPLQTSNKPQSTPPKNAAEYMERVQHLEDHLLKLNVERDGLDSEYSRFSVTSAGRTVAERRRRQEVEGRLGELQKDIASVRLELKKLGCR